MEKISVLRKRPRWLHSWKRCTRRIRSQHVTLLKRLRWAQARSRHGRPSHVRAPCPDAVVVVLLTVASALLVTALVYLRGWVRFEMLPNPHPRLAARAFMCGLVSVWTAIGSPLATLDHQSLTIHMVKHLLLMTVAAPLFLQSNWIHSAEDFSFLAAGILFWLPVVQPLTSGMKPLYWYLPLYLFLATLPCDVSAARSRVRGRPHVGLGDVRLSDSGGGHHGPNPLFRTRS
jgi:hypothetical protein